MVEQELFQEVTSHIDLSMTGKRGSHFSYVIGSNGTGKSQLLAKIAKYYENFSEQFPSVIGCISNAVYDRFVLTSSGRVQYLGVRTSGNAVFHSAIDRQLTKMILKGMSRDPKSVLQLQRTLNLKFIFLIAGSASAIRQKDLPKLVDRRKVKTGNINDYLIQSQRRIIQDLVGKDLIFSDLSSEEIDALVEFVDLNPEVEIFVKQKNSGERINFNELSTGEQNRALTYAKILSVAGDNSLILIDEPEISLHLHWQMDFHSSIRKLLSGLKNYHVVIATHSPTIISEAVKAGGQGKVVVLQNSAAGKRKRSELSFEVHTFAEIPGHEQLVLSCFYTAPFKTTAVDFEIAETVLDAVEEPHQSSQAIKKLEALAEVEGIADLDKRHIESALNIIRKQSLTDGALEEVSSAIAD